MNLEKMYFEVAPKKFIISLEKNKKKDHDSKIRTILSFLPKNKIVFFANWNAKECLKLVKDPDKRIVECIKEVDRYLIGKSTKEKLDAAYSAANSAVNSAAWAAYSAVNSAVNSAAYNKALYNFQKTQLNKLKEIVYETIE